MNFARFSHTVAYSHVISAFCKAYLSPTCICLIELLWLVSICFCVQVAHHSSTLVQVCVCFIVCHYKDTLQKVLGCFYFKANCTMCISNHCIGKQNMFSFASDFEFCTIFTHSCLHYFSLAKGLKWTCHSTLARFSYTVAYSHGIPALQKAWYEFCILH